MSNPLLASLLVGLGGCAGSMARYGVSVALRQYTMEWPLGTMVVNIAGCFFIGVFMELVALGETITPEVRLLLATGFCGGFTTMSSLIYETAEMIRASEYLRATVYVAGSLLLSLTAFYVGMMAVRLLIKTGGGLWN
jgi:CrcB protein